MQVKTLGGLDAGIKPMKPKNLLLLCYLALEGKQDRKHLQMLFWPEAADPATSLRVALSYLQSLEKDLFKSVQNQVEALIHTDAQHLMQAHQQNQHTEVIGLYAGAFLKGLDLRNTSTELEDWIFETREKLASLVQWSILKEAQRVRFSAPEQFQPLMEKFFQVEGAPPPTLEMLRFMYSLGLEGYLEHRVLKEAAELGVDLTTLQVPQKTNLQSAIRPVQVFVGREQEMQLLHERLQQNPPGIVSVTGLGGVGKSTLVRMYCATHHPENTLWLKADGLKDASGLLHQLGLNVQQADPWVGLTDTLRHHKGLVVIDGADQLSGLDHLQHWLRFPDLRVLVTCRQPLQLPEESLLKLEPFSIQEYRGMGLSEVLGHPAVQCFEKHAKRHHAAFKIQPEDAQDALHLCAALSGLPLALEMASSWTQILSLKEIKQEVQQVVDPEGEPQSLKPIFEASWNLLSEQEKQALTNLNCFLGSFTREAAVMVSGVQLRTLQQLVRKSMLQLEPSQRFRVPLVLKGFIPEPVETIRQKHQEYHLHLLGTMEAIPGQGLLEYSGSIPDLMAVVRSARPLDPSSTQPLLSLFEKNNLRGIGLNFYHDLLRSFQIQESPELYIEYAWLCLWMGSPRESYKICKKILSLKDGICLMKAYNILSIYSMSLNDYDQAQIFIENAISYAKQLNDHERYIKYKLNLGYILIEKNMKVEFDHLIEDLKRITIDSSEYYRYQILYLEYVFSEIYQIDDLNIYEIGNFIENCSNLGFSDLKIYGKILLLEVYLNTKNIEGMEKVIEGLNYEAELMEIQTLRCKIAFIEVKFIYLKSGFPVNEVDLLLERIKQDRNKGILLDLIGFLLLISGDEIDEVIHRLEDRQSFTEKQWHQFSQLENQRKRMPKHEQLPFAKKEIQARLESALHLLQWLILMDLPRVEEEDLHPHPEAVGAPHPPEPHPRGPERSL